MIMLSVFVLSANAEIPHATTPDSSKKYEVAPGNDRKLKNLSDTLRSAKIIINSAQQPPMIAPFTRIRWGVKSRNLPGRKDSLIKMPANSNAHRLR